MLIEQSLYKLPWTLVFVFTLVSSNFFVEQHFLRGETPEQIRVKSEGIQTYRFYLKEGTLKPVDFKKFKLSSTTQAGDKVFNVFKSPLSLEEIPESGSSSPLSSFKKEVFFPLKDLELFPFFLESNFLDLIYPSPTSKEDFIFTEDSLAIQKFKNLKQICFSETLSFENALQLASPDFFAQDNISSHKIESFFSFFLKKCNYLKMVESQKEISPQGPLFFAPNKALFLESIGSFTFIRPSLGQEAISSLDLVILFVGPDPAFESRTETFLKLIFFEPGPFEVNPSKAKRVLQHVLLQDSLELTERTNKTQELKKEKQDLNFFFSYTLAELSSKELAFYDLQSRATYFVELVLVLSLFVLLSVFFENELETRVKNFYLSE